MTGDRVIRFTTAAVVSAVAAFAAVVSYSHIYGLGRAHGPDGTAARLLPLSVDRLILAASLVLLHEARNDRDVPRLARFMLWLGIGATIGANIAYGAGYGLLGALISAWPAAAFIGTVEIAMQQVRRARAPRAATSGPAVPEVPGDVESFFTTLGEEVARQIDDLTDELVGEIRQSDSYLAHVQPRLGVCLWAPIGRPHR